MIEHELIERLDNDSRYLVTVNYLENNMMKTTSFTKNFPVLDLQTARFEASKTIDEIYDREMAAFKAEQQKEKELDKNVKGLIE